MKAKTIKVVLRKKIDEWLASIEDEAVRKLAADNTIVTGGCIASMLLGEPVNDFDVYFANLPTVEAVAKHYVDKFVGATKHPMKLESENGRVRIVTKSGHRGETAGHVQTLGDPGEIEDQYEETSDAALATTDVGKPQYRPVFMSTNAITLSNKLQIVLRFYGPADTIHENYDFVHCTNYWTSRGGEFANGELVLRQPALESLLARELRYVGSKYPVCSIMRLRKFIKRGFTVNAGLTGMFLERSERSGVMYLFRRLRPTVAIREDAGRLRILCALCLHPIAYYQGSWAGAMCPTDDVVAHLMLMRGDEPMFWRRANQHPPHRPEAGL